MTIFELTEALKRYWKSATVAFAVLILLVVVMTFAFEDGKPTFRAALKYDSTVQIAVVAPGTDSLISSSEGSGNLSGAASLYASLLGSDEAAKWIGEQNGYTLETAVNATTERNSTVITARVTGPTPEQAKGAALSTFAWLNKRLQEPVETADFPSPPTTVPLLVLDGAFESYIVISFDAGLADVADDLFLSIDAGDENTVSLPLQRYAKSTVRTRVILDPLTTISLTLRTDADQILDTIRLAPEPTPRVVEALPELSVILGDDAVRQITVGEDETIGEDETTWGFDRSEISLKWLEGVVVVAPPNTVTVDVDLALLTPEPGFTSTGGRRGPIVAIAALLIGSVLILTSVIVADTWRRQRDARSTSHLKLTPLQEPSLPDGPGPHTGVEETVTSPIEVRTASLEP